MTSFQELKTHVQSTLHACAGFQKASLNAALASGSAGFQRSKRSLIGFRRGMFTVLPYFWAGYMVHGSLRRG